MFPRFLGLTDVRGPNEPNKAVSDEPQRAALKHESVRLPTTVPIVGCYFALFVESETGRAYRFPRRRTPLPGS